MVCSLMTASPRIRMRLGIKSEIFSRIDLKELLGLRLG